ncbi:SMP-30/gluconolactonase/LRE family protein [Croceibacterium ferulae]|uniref:SMP-30/gluconolactonase/LRE family protein n=1 Tax=Croceibacterium ferulae TaxID=1854641 RepID=UPI000EB42CF6|nr:SMP-30/gluconolactonase/LRE family protein [Croceibacterium ferulae]
MAQVQLGDPEVVWDLGAVLGEGPVWLDSDPVGQGGALWFVDIKAPAIHRYDPATGDKQSWPAPAPVGFCLPAADGTFIAGLKTGLARFDPVAGTFTPLHDPEPDQPDNRLNDGHVDQQGRLWFGTMHDPEEQASGRIYRFDGAGSVAVSDPVIVSNGPAVSPDGTTLYHVDTLGNTIYAADLADDGTVSAERVFVRIEDGAGHPDGVIVDAEGCLWVGLFGGGAIRRYSTAGELLETIPLPVSAITKVAFGGPDRRTLFATTASVHLDDEGRAREPLAGHLFALPVAVAGLPPVSMRLPS